MSQSDTHDLPTAPGFRLGHAISVSVPKSEVRCFTLNDEPIDVREFAADNDLGAAEMISIDAMREGEYMSFGGGAGPLFVLRREVDRG